MKIRSKCVLFKCLMLTIYYPVVLCSRHKQTTHLTESDVETMATMHSHYCGREPNCNGTVFYEQELTTTNSSNIICCDRCSCDLSTCINYNRVGLLTCCPEVLKQIYYSFEMSSCIHPQLKPWRADTKASLERAIVMRHKCDPFEINLELIDKCEHSSNYNDLETKIPVSVIWPSYVVTYVNRYCAYCNYLDDSRLVYWRQKIDCFKQTFDITVTPLKQIIAEIEKSKNCSLYFIPPVTVQSRYLTTCGDPISECNVTGLWKKYDSVIAKGCSAYFSPFQFTYRNIFCYICNTGEHFESHIPVCKLPENAAVSFSLVLKFVPSGSDEIEQRANELECNNSGIYDIVQEKCLAVKCLLSRVYADGECQEIADMMGGLKYHVFLKITPIEIVVYNKYTEIAFTSFFEFWLEKAGLKQPFITEFKASCIASSNVQSFGSIVIDYCSIYFFLALEPAYFENEMLATSTFTWLTEQHNSNLTVPVSLSKSFLCTVQFDAGDYVNFTRNSTDTFDQNFPTLLPVLLCPVAELNTSFYNVTYNTIGLFIEEYDTEIENSEYMKTNSSIIICTETFELLTEKKKKLQRKEINYEMNIQLHDKPQGVLSLVCTIFSITCSVITLIVYVRIKNFRTQPGINNTSLVLSLICAQAFFQFGIGQSENIPVYLCSLIGGLIHYFWLVTILWMNVCSYHMFRIFYHLRVVDHNQKVMRTTCLYWFYCLFAALLPLLINVIVTYSASGEMGYGGKWCYISEYKMVGYCFSLPVAVVILTNLLLFLVTIHKISNQPEMAKERREEKKYLLIYAKMSTLTGVTWIFGFLYFFTNFSVFEYIFIVLNAGQGVFLFLSFVCNARVLRLLKTSVENSTRSLQNS